MDSDDFKSVIALAFRAAESPDWDAFYRKVCRWFSQNLSTPIREVEEMSEEYVLRHYFESRYNSILEEGGENQDQRWADAKANVLKMFYPESELDEQQEEDEFWQKALEEEFAKDNAKIQENKAANEAEPPPPRPDSIWDDLPNLDNNYNIQPDDEIPEG